MSKDAEIEAVARALEDAEIGEFGDTYRQAAVGIIEALDRVRDARGDDETRKTLDALAYRVYYGDDEEAREIARQWRTAARSPQGEDHEERPPTVPPRALNSKADRLARLERRAARSPQGEDHEAGIEAARQALCSGEVDFSPPSFGGDRRKAAEVAIAAYLSRVSRDARGDDEVDQTGWLTEHQRAYRQMQDRARAAEAEVERLRADAARSPQGEDHEGNK
jgi:hypothetical protein